MIQTCYLPWMNNPYITLNKTKQKIRAEKNNTDTPSAPVLSGTRGTCDPPALHWHRKPPLFFMLHKCHCWCTVWFPGAQSNPVPLRWCTNVLSWVSHRHTLTYITVSITSTVAVGSAVSNKIPLTLTLDKCKPQLLTMQ